MLVVVAIVLRSNQPSMWHAQSVILILRLRCGSKNISELGDCLHSVLYPRIFFCPARMSFELDVEVLIGKGGVKRRKGADGAAAGADGPQPAGAKERLLEQLAVSQAREVLRIGREVDMMKSIVVENVILPEGCRVVVAMEQAQLQHQTKTKNNPGHGLGPADYLAGKALIMAIVADPVASPVLRDAFNEEAKKLVNLRAFHVTVKRVACITCFESNLRRVEFAFSPVMALLWARSCGSA